MEKGKDLCLEDLDCLDDREFIRYLDAHPEEDSDDVGSTRLRYPFSDATSSCSWLVTHVHGRNLKTVALVAPLRVAPILTRDSLGLRWLKLACPLICGMLGTVAAGNAKLIRSYQSIPSHHGQRKPRR